MSVIEVLAGPERRRRWPDEEKLAILAEAEGPGHTVSGVARRHGLHPNQVFRWRRLAREGRLGAATGIAGFAPVAVVPDGPAPVSPARSGGLVEVVLGNGRVVRVDAGIDPARLALLVAALEG